MLAQERCNRILEILKARGFVKVEDLVNALGVSDMTVRRDLEKCQQDGLLQRVHGGAMLVNVNQQETRFEEKAAANGFVKKRIAAACMDFVQDGMSVYLDAGTTTFEIAQRLREKRGLKIISNDIRILSSLLDSEMELLVIGGRVQKSTGSVIGRMADQIISNLNMDIAFLGANSINDRMEVMTPTAEKACLKQAVLANASMCYLTADQSKFHSRALYRINHLCAYTGVVTDYPFSKEEWAAVRESKITVIPVLSESQHVVELV